MNAGSVDIDDLTLVVLPHADNSIAGGLRLVGNDGELLLDEAVEERGLTGVGPANQGYEAGLHAGGWLCAAGTGSRRLIRTRVMRRCCVSTISTSRPSTSMCSPTFGTRPSFESRNPPTVSNPCPSTLTFIRFSISSTWTLPLSRHLPSTPSTMRP